MLREGLKKLKYPKGGEGSDFFFCVEIFHYQYKIMLGGGNKTSSRKWGLCMLYRDSVCVMKTIFNNNQLRQGLAE